MGGCGFFAIFNMFKSKRYHRGYDYHAPKDGRRVPTSDEDRGLWVAEPGIDRRAGDYIDKKNAATASLDDD
ncbi:hypothetical protein CsSME_00025261 [Camellia sinensis var. sinensis]|uniref:Uncharacterized protein n=1 Tax=Camellia sinensis TaxID=4442 RepID=A0A7J7H1A3_CAMSI|nr:hypothetical protein HYC85_017010 [Camellia sinensis]